MKYLYVLTAFLAMSLVVLMASWAIFRLVAPDMLNTVGAMDWASGLVLSIVVLTIIHEFSEKWRVRQK